MADPLAGTFHDAARIGQLRAVGELEVDVCGVRRDREHEVTHPPTPAVSQEVVGQVDRLARVGSRLAQEASQAFDGLSDGGRMVG
ncbi:MAG: hypothetical protein M3472_09285 [Chloroflexota bacterium]|nr:hypothetical protein [Chloroflexota bacterium]